MFVASGTTLRLETRYPWIPRATAIVLTPLGVLLSPLFVIDLFGTKRGDIDWRGIVSGAFCLLFGLLALWGWRDTVLVLDRATRTIAYDAKRKLRGNESMRASFDDAARVVVSGTINWTSIYLVMKDGRSLYVEMLPRTTQGKAEMRDALLGIRDALGVEVVVPDYIREWWLNG